MAITEGGTTLPVDSAGKAQMGLYDGTNLYLPHAENSTSKALRISPTDSVGTVMKQDGAVGGKMPAVSHYGTTTTGGDTAVQVAALTVVGDTTTSGAGAAATLSYAAAGAGISHYLGAIHVGYSATPPAGATVTITEDPAGTPLVKYGPMPIAAAGLIVIPFSVRKKFTANKAISIVLSAGGGAIVASISADHWTAA